MADRPILFSAPMVRAILDGRKTQTRRIFNPPLPYDMDDDISVPLATGEISPKIKVGDRLWVRETWAPLSALTHNDPGVTALADGCFYRADQSTVEGEISAWKPSIFMPRAFSRITLLVTDVRVQRLQDIPEEDAIAEGVVRQEVITGAHCYGGPVIEETADRFWNGTEPDDSEGHESAVGAYAALWDHINGAGAWAANPWVAAYTFDEIGGGSNG